MSELLLKDEKLTTADIAYPERAANVQPAVIDDSNPQPEQAVIASQKNAESSSTPLFPDDELHNLRARWDQIQTSFVDEPREAVEQADSLVANVVKRIAEQFSNERAKLGKSSGQRATMYLPKICSQGLKRYRAFFDRLLSF